MTGDCQFTLTSGGTNNLVLTNGSSSSGNPAQPLSDVTAVQSLTTPNNEPCTFPYTYTPGNWQMYFCRRYSATNYSCPTNSGLGQCAMGKFAGIRASATTSKYNQTYVTDGKQSSSTTQCLDFYYYIPGTTNNPKIQVGWKADADTQQIVELTAHSENKWQNIRSSFTAPSSSFYQLTFRMMRDAGSFSYAFGLDEIKIYNQPCDSVMTTTISIVSTTTIEAGTTTPVLPDTTTPVPTTTTTPIPTTTTPIPTTTTPVPTTTTPIPTTTTPIPTTTTPIPTTTTPIPTMTTTVPTTTTSTTTVFTTSTNSESPVVTQDVEETSSANIPIVTTGGELVVTNGSEFTSVDIINEPPRAPLSDVSSINEPTDNNELCKLPYQPSIDNSTNENGAELWFCYKNQCPTESQQLANCKSGNYGLISIEPWESSKTINESINEEMMIRSSVGQRCLRYYYYFTVYDKLDWGQHISVLIKFDNETNNEIEIDRLSAVDMIENRWYSRDKTFNSILANYSLMFRFEVTNVNRTDNPASNKTIYFALDNIELFNQNCQSVTDPSTGQTTISQSPATTSKSDEVTPPPPPPPNNLGLILGLSLGLGIPLLLFIIGSVFFTVKRSKQRRIIVKKENQSTIHMEPINGTSKMDYERKYTS
ncbi:unnamed protein product [Rotaria sordida]|uniref:MAM domain-containing protein n=1 Tax=Rotaria sordida TaxID=392033 RepID=A0A814T3K1_9BILA|nr:unnamed protein product [Rotaria sordida]